MFGRKPKKTADEIRKESEEKVAKTSSSLRLLIATLEKKKKNALDRVVKAKQLGLKEQEVQARNLLRQNLAAIKRAQGMLMTLELALEARDLAQLNMNFLESIGTLSDEIISSGKQTSEGKTKKVGDKYLRAVYEANRQKDRIDAMLAVGEYSSVISQDAAANTEFDSEIDSLVEAAEQDSSAYSGINDTGIRTKF